MSKSLEEYSREELIAKVRELKSQKKFGLVWEDKPEKVVKECETKLPVVKEVEEKAIENASGEPTNIIIEGDNYHALSVLNYTHAGKVDVIYIDPPYNTGNKDFVYNDCYVDKEDTFRHSKWLSFMDKRLRLAKNLLADDGVIFISIDDNEQASLKLLCDSIFGECNFVENFIWEKNPNPTFLNRFSRSSSEYVMCYAVKKDDGLCELDGGIVVSTETDAPLQNKGNPKRRITIKSGMAKALFPDQLVRAGNYGLVDVLNEVVFRNGINANEFTIEGTFRMTQETMYKRIESGEQLLFKTPRMSPRLSYSANSTHSAPLKNLRSDKYGTTQIGNNDIKSIFNVIPFSYPKPTQLIKNLILFKNKKDAVILDFFAGSGTTGQAVMELNKEDGGHRQFILVTNNENQIAENVTYPRIKTVITGIRPDGTKYSDGIPANLRYFKTDFVEKGKTTDDTREALIAECCDMIRIRENAFEHVASTPEYRFYKNDNIFVPIIFDQFAIAETWEKVEELNTEKLPVHCYNFSYNRHANEEEIPEDTELEWTACSIPETVLEVYRKIFRKEGKKEA